MNPAPFCLIGIVNVTPDSFSDGGKYIDPRNAVAHGLRLLDEGAGMLDLGAESTRPFAEPVPEGEESPGSCRLWHAFVSSGLMRSFPWIR